MRQTLQKGHINDKEIRRTLVFYGAYSIGLQPLEMVRIELNRVHNS